MRARQRAKLLALAWLVAFTAARTAHAEPPDPPGLACEVTAQRVAAGASPGMSLELRFSNSTGQDLELGPGPHLVWYHDAAAEDAMEHTARADRVQNTPWVLPAGQSRQVLLLVAPAALQQLRCNAALPQAAALYFYQFNRRPRFRCRLQGYALDAVQPGPTCPARGPGPR